MNSAGNGGKDQIGSNVAGASIRERLRNSKISQETPSTFYGSTKERDTTGDIIADLFPNCTVLFAVSA